MTKSKQIKILVTGGHITPAIAVIEELRMRFPDWEIALAGRSYAFDRERTPSEEKRLAGRSHMRFIPIETGRLTRTWSVHTFLSLLKIPRGFVQAWRLLIREKPAIILSFGGYVALPVVIGGWLLGIPSVTHEQTRVIGLANRLIELLAKKIAISFPDQQHRYLQSKVVYTGLPIRKEMLNVPKNFSLPIQTTLPIVFITGGSTGARSMNEVLFACLPELVKKYMVIHQTGSLSLARAKDIKEGLPPGERSRYHVLQYVDMPAYAWIFYRAHFLIGRSGANTVGEAATIGKVAIWIPLPWSSGGEQKANAGYLAGAGSSIVIDQRALTPATLLATIGQMESDFDSYQAHAKSFARSMPRDGARRVVDLLCDVLRV